MLKSIKSSLKVIHNKYTPGGFAVFYLNPIFDDLFRLLISFFGV
jgi:hypothetical protein